MPRDGRPGIARPLLERVERELALSGKSKAWLSRETGLARSTIDRLATIGRPEAQTVVKIADALEVDRVEALALAGLLPGENESAEERLDRLYTEWKATRQDELREFLESRQDQSDTA